MFPCSAGGRWLSFHTFPVRSKSFTLNETSPDLRVAAGKCMNTDTYILKLLIIGIYVGN